ncbi:MAG TPA: hypothetical protein VE575_05175, partial [Acidimicrobiales bacterium]|nr:hypothetical protein [Acidimicrobiales bacterium]
RLGRSLSEAEGRALYERTGGNPLFCEEVLAGGVDRPGSAVTPAGSVLHERLDRLDPAGRELLEIASVAGPIFTAELVAHVAGADPADVASSVAALVAAGLVQHRSDGTLQFRHALVAEAAYDRLDPTRRAELHRAWADTLVEAWPPAADHPAAIAGHLLAARPRSEAAEARRWATRAAVAAADRLAPDDAALWYERALGAVDPRGDDDVERYDLLLALGRARLQGTGTVPAMQAFGEAAEAAGRAGDDVRRLEALVWLTEARYRAPGVQLNEAARLTLAAAIDATPGAPAGLAARAAEQLARVETFRGTSERAHAVAHQALAAARRSGDPEGEAAAARALRWALVGPFGMEEKRQASRRLADGLGPRSHPANWWNAHSWMLLDALEAGDRPLIDAELQSCRRLADRLREPFLSALTVAWQTAVALLEGGYDEAERMIARGLEAADGAGVNAGGLYAQLGYLAWDRGEHAALVELVRGVAEAVPDRSALYRALLAGIYAEQGRSDEANFELDRLAVDGFAHVPRDGDWLTALAWCATACARLDRAELAVSLRGLLAPFRDRGVVAGGRPFLFCGSVAYYTGMLAVTAGDPDAALHDLAMALAFHQRLRARPWVAYTLCEQGGAWLARGAAGDGRRAAAALATAGDEADALGMEALAARAADLARQRPEAHPTLAPQGSGWRVGFSGAPFHLHDCKGLRCLHHLLARPGVPVRATELVSGVLGDPAADPERARVNVTRQLRGAVDRIGEHDRDLHAHLRAAVVTGRECAYRPAGAPPAWRLG